MEILESLFLSHCIATSGFLIAALFFAKLRKVIPTFLSTANSIAAVLALVNVIYMIVDLINAWEASPDHTFFKYRAVTFVPCIVIYVAAISLTLSKKLRATVAFSLILVIVYTCLFFSAYIEMIIYNLLPIPIKTTYYIIHNNPNAYILPLLGAVGYFVICYFIAVKKHARQNH